MSFGEFESTLQDIAGSELPSEQVNTGDDASNAAVDVPDVGSAAMSVTDDSLSAQGSYTDDSTGTTYSGGVQAGPDGVTVQDSVGQDGFTDSETYHVGDDGASYQDTTSF